jgi:hypothetical protein
MQFKTGRKNGRQNAVQARGKINDQQNAVQEEG